MRGAELRELWSDLEYKRVCKQSSDCCRDIDQVGLDAVDWHRECLKAGSPSSDSL